jgi:beta-phosphoglucomutase-like phosphatase (HAD superfamily)
MALPMAIATSSRNSSVIQKRQKHSHLFSYMKHIVTGDDPAVRYGKPNPDIFLEAARRLGVKPSNCLVFEDSIAGCQAGKSAGCYVVAVPDPRMGKSEFYGIVNEVIDSLDCFDGQKFGITNFKTKD